MTESCEFGSGNAEVGKKLKSSKPYKLLNIEPGTDQFSLDLVFVFRQLSIYQSGSLIGRHVMQISSILPTSSSAFIFVRQLILFGLPLKRNRQRLNYLLV
jgi:hypothetical protein